MRNLNTDRFKESDKQMIFLILKQTIMVIFAHWHQK